MKKEDLELVTFVNAYLKILIINPDAKEKERRDDRVALVKIMKRSELFGFQNKVALSVLDALHRIRVGHHNEDILYNLLAILLGNNGHGVKFSPDVLAQISKMRKRRRWKKLSGDSPSRILLGE